MTSLVTFSFNNKYRLVITDNPATTITLGWNQVSGSSPILYYDIIDHGTNWSNYSNSKSVDRSVYYKGMNNTFIKMTGLTPDTNYYFIIKDSEGVSDRFWFKTAPSTNKKLSFIAGGDSRNNRAPRRKANLLVAKLKPTAVFFGGDMTNGDSSLEWKKWFDDWQNTIADDGRMFPIIPARGNHEDSNNSIYNLFNVPSSKIYYDITFGNDLFTMYTLNSEISAGGNQLNWLKHKLSSNTAIWKSVQYHKPMRPHVSSKSEGNDEYSNWSTLFHDYRVKLVFESDSHTVKTTWPVRPCSDKGECDEGFIRDDISGTVYVGEGCWGAPLRSSNDNKTWTRNASSFNQFKWFFVDESKIEVRTVKVGNATTVGSVTNDDPFFMPTNIDIWTPSNGSVVTILNPNIYIPEIEIKSPLNNASIEVNSKVNISTKVLDADGYVKEVRFYVNDSLIKIDKNPPFDASWIPIVDKKLYKLKAIAFDNETNESFPSEISVFVGDVTRTMIAKITRSNDDAEEYQSSGKIYMNSSDLEMTYDGIYRGNQHVGLLFRNINIPKDAAIKQAYIQFTVDEINSSSTSLNIKVENASNATEISPLKYNITSREYNRKKVSWNPEPWSSIGASEEGQRTPDLSSLVQDIVNKSNWKYGNRILFYISGKGERTAESYDGNVSKAPQLVVKYTKGIDGNISFCKEVSVKLIFDQYASETSWKMKNLEGEILMSGSEYSKNKEEIIISSKCLPVDCYEFIINDTSGDGICCDFGKGLYQVINSDKEVLASGNIFGSHEVKTICLSEFNAKYLEQTKSSKINSVGLLLYPNPVVNKIKIKERIDTLFWTAIIKDINGKVIDLVPVINGEIDLTYISSSNFYFIEIFDEKKQLKSKNKIYKK